MGSERRERQKANRLQKQVDEERAGQRRALTRKVVLGVGVVAGLFVLLLAIAFFTGDDDDEPADEPPATEAVADPVADSVAEPVSSEG